MAILASGLGARLSEKTRVSRDVPRRPGAQVATVRVCIPDRRREAPLMSVRFRVAE